MSADERELGRIQQWMQAVIMHPSGVEAGVASDAARSVIDVSVEELERVVTRSRALSASDRLAVYGNAYFARLLECVRDEYPASVHILGQELFDEFAFAYLQAYPSKSYTLNRLGANFPRHLAETCPDDNPDWAAFLIDLATLERVYDDVFDGPGPEGKESLSADALRAISPDRWPHARLIPTGGLRLVELRSPVHEYITAVRREEDPALPVPAETLLAVYRRDFVVRRQAVSRAQYALLQSVIAGEPVAVAIEKAAGVCTDPDTFAADLWVWFRDWAASGFFAAVDISSEEVTSQGTLLGRQSAGRVGRR